MTSRGHSPSSIERRLLEEPRRSAGIDSGGQPVRLGERDSSGHLVGYIDEQGLAWESLTERIVAQLGGRLLEALALPYDDPQRDRLMEQLLAEVPDELIGDIARAAGEALAIRDLADGLDL
jgi:hypothetical protein